MKKKKRKERGQALVEYIIIIVIVAIVSLAILGTFSNRVRSMIAGATNSLGGEASTENPDSLSDMRELKSTGIETD